MKKVIKTIEIEKEFNYVDVNDFLDWLKQHDALDKFVINLTDRGERYNKKYIFSADVKVSKIIDCAFDWGLSFEGEDYWYEIDSKWKKYCRDNNIEETLYWEEDND